MNRLNRHDYILMARRKRQRIQTNRPRPWLWAGQSIGAILLTVLLAVGVLAGVGAGAVYGIYTSYAAQMPDASVIELQQDEFETVRIYDRTGNHLLYESIDPRPFRGDREVGYVIDGSQAYLGASQGSLVDFGQGLFKKVRVTVPLNQ